MKKIVFSIAAVLLLGTVACQKNNDGDIAPSDPSLDTLRGQITADRTLDASKTYYLDGPVFVKNNATLTIKEGVIVKAIKTGKTKATANSSSFLVITRGCKIEATGTQTKPVVFTSAQPAGSRATADWGGVMLLGNAKVNSSFGGVASRRQMEGFSDNDGAAYGQDIVGGGDNDADNSGTLKYVRIEFAGIALSNKPNSELNSLTFIGVGSGTTIDHVQSSFSGDDSFEWFGGTVNCKYLVAYRGLDDDFDTDNGFSGKVQFGLSIRDKDISDTGLPGNSNGFESDNDELGTDNAPLTNPVFSNITFIGPYSINNGANIPANHVFTRAAHIRRNSRLSAFNCVFTGYPNGIYIDGDKSATAALGNTLEIKNSFVGTITGTIGGNVGKKVSTNSLTFDAQAWFTTAAFGNDISIDNIADFKFANMSGDLKTIDARPIAGSPLLNKASFSSSAKIQNAFFKPVTYVGAFDVNDTWLTGWTNFDPKNATY
ncbi:hypothetical protein [Solitalea koreensis]|uniref:T9SS C-terminal target domain-containing protein n=1 Tax=Solitalea koreensis TaxID=543615 RepID=A0A521DTE6_9SPHI|nr:hypothetical protein [Solitalea koreensis]SMO74895.1 hypothetical protein SAMN06265350_108101 [Solitalea koreensis]